MTNHREKTYTLLGGHRKFGVNALSASLKIQLL